MSGEWVTKPLGEVAENISRPFGFKGRDKVIFINTGDVLEGDFLHSDYSPVKGLPGQAKKAIQKGDILYSEIRPGNKRYVLIDFEADDYVVSTKFMVIRPTADVSSEYLYLILTGRECEQEFKLIADSRSGTFPQITFDSVSYYPVHFPKQENDQKRLVDISNSFQWKLKLNTQTNQTLEQIAQAIFKSWFVDFEPVKAKMAVLAAGGTAEQAELAAMSAISAKDEAALQQLQAEQPDADAQGSANVAGGRMPGATYTELAQTAALFPSAMEESELGEIPEGWSISNLKSISEKISKGTTPRKPDITKATDPSIVTFIKVKDISDDGEINRSGLENIPLSIHEKALKRSILTTDDLLFSIAGTIGRVSIVDDDLDNSNTNQAVAFVRLSDKERFLELCFLTLKSKRVQEEIKSKVVQGVQANASLTNIGDIQVVIPDDAVLKAWKKIIYPFISEKRNLSGLNRKLSSLRNTLLPKLLSGEVAKSTKAVNNTGNLSYTKDVAP